MGSWNQQILESGKNGIQHGLLFLREFEHLRKFYSNFTTVLFRLLESHRLFETSDALKYRQWGNLAPQVCLINTFSFQNIASQLCQKDFLPDIKLRNMVGSKRYITSLLRISVSWSISRVLSAAKPTCLWMPCGSASNVDIARKNCAVGYKMTIIMQSFIDYSFPICC